MGLWVLRGRGVFLDHHGFNALLGEKRSEGESCGSTAGYENRYFSQLRSSDDASRELDLLMAELFLGHGCDAISIFAERQRAFSLVVFAE